MKIERPHPLLLEPTVRSGHPSVSRCTSSYHARSDIVTSVEHRGIPSGARRVHRHGPSRGPHSPWCVLLTSAPLGFDQKPPTITPTSRILVRFSRRQVALEQAACAPRDRMIVCAACRSLAARQARASQHGGPGAAPRSSCGLGPADVPRTRAAVLPCAACEASTAAPCLVTVLGARARDVPLITPAYTADEAIAVVRPSIAWMDAAQREDVLGIVKM